MLLESVLQNGNRAHFKLSELMSVPPKTLKAEDTLWTAAQHMLKTGFSSLPVLDDNGVLIGAVGFSEVSRMYSPGSVFQETLEGHINKKPSNVVKADFCLHDISFPESENVLFVCHDGKFEGVVRLTTLLEVYRSQETVLQRFEKLSREYECILNNCDDSLMFTDERGNILWMNQSNERLCGHLNTMEALNVIDLERQGILCPSVVRMAIEEKQQKTCVQRSSSGKYLIVTGTPIFGMDGKLVRVVATSRNMDELFLRLQAYLGQDACEWIEDVSYLAEEIQNASLKAEKLYSELNIFRENTEKINQTIKCPSAQMQAVAQKVERTAKVDSVVLLLGESGVGKGVYANAIHQKSKRKDEPFISVNCGAIPETLLESELFGYEPGSFTGAGNKRKLGLFEVANGGTLFLDEIAELPLALQVKLLHVLQERRFIRVGGTKSVSVDVRIIAATNKNLDKLVKEGKFREDLYYRLNVVPIEIPPLRTRKEDISTFVLHFLDTFNRKYQRNRQITSEIMGLFLQYDWPGNIREVENLMERLVVIGEKDIIYPIELPQNMWSREYAAKFEDEEKQLTLEEAVRDFEIKTIQKAYKKYNSTQKVAEVLGVNRTTIVRKLKKALPQAEK